MSHAGEVLCQICAIRPTGQCFVFGIVLFCSYPDIPINLPGQPPPGRFKIHNTFAKMARILLTLPSDEILEVKDLRAISNFLKQRRLTHSSIAQNDNGFHPT